MFKVGVNQGINDILNHKEQRANLQKRLLNLYPEDTLVVFTLNIPGPIKRNSDIEKIFRSGKDDLGTLLYQRKIKSIYSKNIELNSGLDFFLVVKEDPYKIKKMLMSMEESHPLGRLFDFDVLYLTRKEIKIISRKELGGTERICLVCDKPAKICSRSRAHSIKEMQETIQSLFLSVEQGESFNE